MARGWSWPRRAAPSASKRPRRQRVRRKRESCRELETVYRRQSTDTGENGAGRRYRLVQAVEGDNVTQLGMYRSGCDRSPGLRSIRKKEGKIRKMNKSTHNNGGCSAPSPRGRLWRSVPQT